MIIDDLDIEAASLNDLITWLGRAGKDLLRSLTLFDEYEGANLPEGSRSLAFHLEFGSLERTLDTADTERLRGAIEEAIAKRGWTLRT